VRWKYSGLLKENEPQNVNTKNAWFRPSLQSTELSPHMAKIYDSRLNLILENRIVPILKEHGFKENQLTFTRQFESIAFVIDLQKSRWNDKSGSQFTLNIGIYVPEVFSIYTNKMEPTKIRLEHCTLHIRIGMLDPSSKDIWWTLSENDSFEVDNQISQELIEKLNNLVFPFFSKFDNSLDVARFLASDLGKEFNQLFPFTKAQRLAYSAIIYFKMGEQAKSKELFETACNASRKSPIEGIINAIKSRIF